MDDFMTHKGDRIRELLESVGCELLYQPPYSPDPAPINGDFLEIRGLLRKAKTTSWEAVIEALCRTLAATTCRRRIVFFIELLRRGLLWNLAPSSWRKLGDLP